MDLFDTLWFDYYLCARGQCRHRTIRPGRVDTSTVLLFSLDDTHYTHSNILSTKWNLLIIGRIPIREQYQRVKLTAPVAPSDMSINDGFHQRGYIFVQVIISPDLERRVTDVQLPAISVYNPYK